MSDDVFASTQARKLADELGLSAEHIDGHGREGRITIEDVRAAAPPEPPDDLGDEGAALWRELVRALPPDWEFDPRELTAIKQAARQMDEIATLERELNESGRMITGAAGQLKPNPLIAELRAQRLAVVKMLGVLALPGGETGEQVFSGASERARKAAEARWGRKRNPRQDSLLSLVGDGR